MKEKVEKTFEERVVSLKKGCFILGVFQLITTISAFINFTKQGEDLLSLFFSILWLLMLYYIYKCTKDRNPVGPILETIYGAFLLLMGIWFCLTIAGIIIGIIFIVIAIGILKEAKYFRKEIKNN